MWYGHPSQHGTQAYGHPGHKRSPKNWVTGHPHDHDPQGSWPVAAKGDHLQRSRSHATMMSRFQKKVMYDDVGYPLAIKATEHPPPISRVLPYFPAMFDQRVSSAIPLESINFRAQISDPQLDDPFCKSRWRTSCDFEPMAAYGWDFYPEIPGGVKTCGSLKQFENHAAASHQITIHRHLGHWFCITVKPPTCN